MINHDRGARAGGFILALSILVGGAVGIAMRQSSIGILAGFAVGMVLLVLIWLWDQR